MNENVVFGECQNTKRQDEKFPNILEVNSIED